MQQLDALQEIVKASGYVLAAGNWDQMRYHLNQGDPHEALEYLKGRDIEFHTWRGQIELVKLNGGWSSSLSPRPKTLYRHRRLSRKAR